MVRIRTGNIIVFLVVVDALSALLINSTVIDLINNNQLETRRKRKKERSTSSSSRDDRGSKSESGVSGESLDLSTDSSSSSATSRGRNRGKKYYKPKSSLERRGWRKWHRKCHPCPEEMKLKWRDPSIKWICGSYQRARRSFKSLCMMHYRNCQDGTMFTKIGDHRCANDTRDTLRPHGDHFFYDYKVEISGESSKTSTSESTETDSSSSF